MARPRTRPDVKGFRRLEAGGLSCLQCGDEVTANGFSVGAHRRKHESRREPGPCIVCGRWSLPYALEGKAAECGWCGSLQDDWAFLRSIPTMEGTVDLRCPYSRRFPDHSEMCPGIWSFPAKAFFVSEDGVAGNGPYSYLLDNRFKLQGRCSTCENYAYGEQLIRPNRDVLLAFVGRSA